MPGRPKGSRDASQRSRKSAQEIRESVSYLAENGGPAADGDHNLHVNIEAVTDSPDLKQKLAPDVCAFVPVQSQSWTDPCADASIESESRRVSFAGETVDMELVSHLSSVVSVDESDWNDPFHADWPFWKTS